VACLRVLLWSEGWFKPFRIVNKKMLLASLLMLIFASLDVAFHLRHNLEAFIWFNGDPVDDFERTSYWLNVIKMGCYVAQTFVGDSILLFRCWIVYGRSWLVIFLPIILWLGTTACGIMTVYVEATLDNTGQLLNSKSLIPFITSMLCLTLVTNVLTTTLIVLRIWGVQRNLKGKQSYTNSPLSSLLIVLIESGLMYTLSIIILFGLYMASNNGQYGVSNAVVQIIGITFNLIITSVDRKEAYTGSTTQQVRSQSQGGLPLHNMINIQTTIDRFPDEPLHTSRKSLDSDDPTSHPTSPSSKVAWAR